MRIPSYLILGGGHFGRLAAERLLKLNSQSKILIVEKEEKTCTALASLPVEVLLGEGISALDHLLTVGRSFDYVVPALPLHVAFEFLLLRLNPLGARRVPIPLLPNLPNPHLGKTGDLCTSLADFLCPDDCPEPLGYCTVTQRKREKDLHEILAEVFRSHESRIIQSQQLAPGVGGFSSETLLNLWQDLRDPSRLHPPILVSTACRCHGVTSAFSFGNSRHIPSP